MTRGIFLLDKGRVLIFCMALVCCSHVGMLAGQIVDQVEKQQEPSKQALIDSLRTIYPLLKQKQFVEAAKLCALPPNFDPANLDGMIARQEISVRGIEILEKNATFGKASELFGADRAARYAGQAKVNVENCYGFNHQANSQVAEVIALWNGSQFKLVRIDDVGKISPTASTDEPTKTTKGDVARQLPELKAAVAATPDDVATIARYAMALYQVENTREAWLQLMNAYKIDPSHEGISRGIAACLTAFERQGVLAANVPKSNLTSALGPPQKTVPMIGRARLIYGFIAIDLLADQVYEIIDLRDATKDLFTPNEKVMVDTQSQGLFCGYRKKSKNSSLSKYYPSGQSMKDWKESLEIERILGAAKLDTMEKTVDIMMQQIKSTHPDARHNILEKSDDSMIIGVVIPARPEFKFEKRYQLIRLWKGKTDVYRLAYTIKTDQLSSEKEERWLDVVKSAALISTK